MRQLDEGEVAELAAVASEAASEPVLGTARGLVKRMGDMTSMIHSPCLDPHPRPR